MLILHISSVTLDRFLIKYVSKALIRRRRIANLSQNYDKLQNVHARHGFILTVVIINHLALPSKAK